jgi:hypothetical protein
MKKAILIVAALVLVLSGVAAVSAYEAHTINVRAHVENAMSVNVKELDFETVFPEEWLIKTFTVQVSSSFCEETQTRVGYIDYELYAEWKPLNDGFYNWMGYFTYVGIDAAVPKPQAAGGDLVLIGDPPANQPGAKLVMRAPKPLHKFTPLNMADIITVGIDVPVFEGYYNEITDAMWQEEFQTTKPSGLDEPTWVVPADFPGFDPNGMDFGLDLKVQVIWVGATPAPY